MTNKQAIEMMKAKLECMTRDVSGTDPMCIRERCDDCALCYAQGNMGEQKEWLRMGIRALEQEECEDVISRQAVLKLINSDWKYEGLESDVENLPSVKPQTKIGHWITWKEAGNEIPSETRFECSVCHDAAQTLCNGLDLLSPYCPNCGADMRGEIE